MPLTRTARERLEAYGAYHRDPRTKATHAVGVPLIVVAVLGLLGRFPLLGPLDLGLVAWVAATVYYVRIDWRIGVPFALTALGVYTVGRFVPLSLLVLAFLTGWALQAVGHVFFERNRPAFTDNVEHLLTGPLWIFARAVGALAQ